MSSELSLHVADTTQMSQGPQRWEEEGLQGTPVLCPPGLQAQLPAEGMFPKVAAAGLRLTLNLLEQISRGGAPASVP